MLLQFREHQHLVDAMLRQGMQFKEKPLLLAVVLIDHQIDDFHRHNSIHRDIDMYSVPLVGAYDKCHERQADGSMMELFGDTASIDTVSFFPNIFNCFIFCRKVSVLHPRLDTTNESVMMSV